MAYSKEYLDMVMNTAETAMQYGATWDQIETLLIKRKTPVSRTQFWKECKKRYGLTFEQLREKKKEDVKLLLRQKAINMALDGNVSMLIFSLKNIAGWSDKVTHSGETENPIGVSIISKKKNMHEIMKDPEGREAAAKIIDIARRKIQNNKIK